MNNLLANLASIQGELEGYALAIDTCKDEVNWEKLTQGLREQAQRLENIRKILEEQQKS